MPRNYFEKLIFIEEKNKFELLFFIAAIILTIAAKLPITNYQVSPRKIAENDEIYGVACRIRLNCLI